jgi:hypothetical protein
MTEELEKTPKKSSNRAYWIKGLYIVLFLVIGYLVGFVTFFVVIFQFIFNFIMKEPNVHIQNFGQSISVYLYDITRFITFNSEELPFPFKPWPSSTVLTEVTHKKGGHKH